MEQTEKVRRNWLKLYMTEILEAATMITIIRVAVGKPIVMNEMIRDSLFIGLLTLVMEQYSVDLTSNVKQGISFTLGATLLNRHM